MPVVLTKILDQCGFDCVQTLKCLDQNSINEIEQFLNEDLEKHRDFLHGSVYEQKSVFKLLPGHRALILKLPSLIDEHKVSKENQNEKWNQNFLSS